MSAHKASCQGASTGACRGCTTTTLCRYCRAITWRADGVCGRCDERCCWPTAPCDDCRYDVAREESRG